MPSASKKKVGSRNVLGSPFTPKEACPKLNNILRESLKDVWPPRIPSSKALIRRNPELLKLPSKEDRAKRLKELKSRSSIPIHSDRKFVKAGLKSCLRSLSELSVLLLDNDNPNVSTLSSTLFPLQRPGFTILLVDKLSKICEEFLGFHCLSLGFSHLIADPSNRFYSILTYTQSLTQSSSSQNNGEEKQPPVKKVKVAIPKTLEIKSVDFGADFIAFGEPGSDEEDEIGYINTNLLRVPIVHSK